jgi:hypothetical protein
MALVTARISLKDSVVAAERILFAGFFTIALNLMAEIDAFADTLLFISLFTHYQSSFLYSDRHHFHLPERNNTTERAPEPCASLLSSGRLAVVHHAKNSQTNAMH